MAVEAVLRSWLQDPLGKRVYRVGCGATIIEADLNPSDRADSAAAVGCRIRVRGVANSSRDVLGRATRVRLSVGVSGDIEVLARPPQNIPVRTVRELASLPRDSLTERMLHLHSGIRSDGLRHGLRFEDGTGSIRIPQGPAAAGWGLDRKSIASRMVALGSNWNARSSA